ncbi:DUF7172 family protein [Hoyosella altamirensis]|uniref:DUF7172 family protein n=1 Tax=Hoyosella altamirensis TaxID=616997 RepID=UPI0007DB1100|nr:hypothetical protein [Hoyosella altamirensis]
MAICHDNSFATAGGELTLTRTGTWRPVRSDLVEATADGTFTAHPSPGRTHIEIDTTWVNNTGVPQRVQAIGQRGPRTIIVANRRNAAFRERWTTAVGDAPRADEPSVDDPSSMFASTMNNPPGFFAPPPRAIVSYAVQDRSSFLILETPLDPGEGINVRYRCALFTDTLPIVTGGTPRQEAFARWAEITIWACPRGV